MTIIGDNWRWVEVYRVDGTEQQVGAFRTRIARADAGTLGRDKVDVQGSASEAVYVMDDPDGVCQQGDEVWSEEERYRVVAVDRFQERDRQVVLTRIQ
jgi:hypothetical protein